MMNESQQKSRSSYEEELDLRVFFRTLWIGKWLICGITVATTVIAVIIALMLPNIYRAQALLAPNENATASGLSAMAAQYGGLASLAGINLDNGSTDNIAIGLEILKSRKFISTFIETHELLVPIMAADGWVEETDELRIDADIYDVPGEIWVRDVRRPKKPTPSLQEAYEKFSEDILSISQNKRTSFVTISIDYFSPTIAKQWVDWLIEDINSTVMRKDVDEAEQAIAYLEGQISATSLASLQEVFFSLIEEQTKTVMLANISDEYLLETLDPAIVPEEKAKPSRALIVIMGFLLGGLSGISISLLRPSRS
jgi:capsular polysaccharide biosynthesis protein